MTIKRHSKRTRPARMSRSRIDKILAHLAESIPHQIHFAEAIKNLAAPNGNTMVAAIPMLSAIELALGEHVKSLRAIYRFHEILTRREAVQS